MGGAVSSARDNSELVDNLLQADYIRSVEVYGVLKAVDRGEYFLPDYRTSAYKDQAWKSGHLHLSAPCIYSEVLECLQLKPGLSFLNLGSGTGYLSTIVGLVLGSSGINHGIEIHGDVIEYANEKLEDFKKYSGAIDEYDFCEPKFIKGNCLCLSSDSRQYDRIYCGAACPEPYESYMKNLLKIGGVLVMPLDDRLIQIKRTSETNWNVRQRLSVSFATLVTPREEKEQTLHLMDIEPMQLQALCRATIRNLLRKQIAADFSHTDNIPKAKKIPKKKRALRNVVVPIFDDASDEQDDAYVNDVSEAARDFGRIFMQDPGSNEGRRMSTVIDLVLERLRENTRRAQGAGQEENGAGQEENGADTSAESLARETEEREEEVESAGLKECDMQEDEVELEEHESEESEEIDSEEETGDRSGVRISTKTGVIELPPRKAWEAKYKFPNKREKFDSGLGEEMVEKVTSSSNDSESEDTMDVEMLSSSDERYDGRRNKRFFKPQTEIRTGGKWRKISSSTRPLENADSSDSDSETDNSKEAADERRMMVSRYTPKMKSIIQQLPLPPVLKNYLNYYREF